MTWHPGFSARLPRVLPGLLASAALLAGCGIAQSAHAPVGDVAAGGVVRLSGADKEVLHLAEETLVARCMRDAGFQYVVTGQNVSTDGESMLYSSDDVAERSRIGYDLNGQTGQPPDANAEYLSTLSESQQKRYDEALLGPPNSAAGRVRLLDGAVVNFSLSGCVAKARGELYGDNERFMAAATFVDNLRSEIEIRMQRHAKYREVLERWRQCMQQRGHQVDDPGAAMDLASEQAAQERVIAVADAECSKESGLTATGRELYRTLEAEVAAENTDQVATYAQLVESGLPKAREILGR